MSYSTPGSVDRKSNAEKFRAPAIPPLPLTLAEKANRVAELRRQLHAPTFQAALERGEQGDRP